MSPRRSPSRTPKHASTAATDAPRRLQSQVALITGASQGIGYAIAEALATEGCDLVLVGRSGDALAKAEQQLENSVSRIAAVSCDIRDQGAVTRLFDMVRQQFGRIDILINNAGVAHSLVPVDKMNIDVWRDVIDTNVNGLFFCTRAALPLMNRGATIVNNISVSGYRVFPNMAAYTT